MHSHSTTSAKAISVANIAHPSTNNGVDTNVWTGKTRMGGELRHMTAFKLFWLMGGIALLAPDKICPWFRL